MAPHRCLSEQELCELASGLTEPEERDELIQRIEDCQECAFLLAEAGQAASDQAGDDQDSPSSVLEKGGLKEGDLFAERYRVLRSLGRGGMGEVYLVHDEELDEWVALKTVVALLARNPTALERFKREVRLARKVHHENVCRVFEFGRHTQLDGVTIHYLTMVYLRGETLRERMGRLESLDEQWVLRIVAGLAHGLHAIHQAGILHRDIKPDNVMLVETEAEGIQPQLLDFGIARQETLETGASVTADSKALVGTLDYMAPEQLESKPLSLSSDLYSLGVVMYHALTGHLPFEGGAGMSRAVKKLQSDPLPASHWLPSVSTEADSIVSWCLKREPTQRPSTAEQLAQHIESALSGAKANRVSPSIRAAVDQRQHSGLSKKMWATVTVAAGGVCALALAFGWGDAGETAASPPQVVENEPPTTPEVSKVSADASSLRLGPKDATEGDWLQTPGMETPPPQPDVSATASSTRPTKKRASRAPRLLKSARPQQARSEPRSTQPVKAQPKSPDAQAAETMHEDALLDPFAGSED